MTKTNKAIHMLRVQNTNADVYRNSQGKTQRRFENKCLCRRLNMLFKQYGISKCPLNKGRLGYDILELQSQDTTVTAAKVTGSKRVMRFYLCAFVASK